MALDVSALAAYVENQDFPLIAKLQVSTQTAALVSKQTGIKGSSNLHFLDTNVILQDNTCADRVASGTTTLSDKTIVVSDMATRENLCPKALIGKWAQIELSLGATGDSQLPGAIESVYVESKMADLMEVLDVVDWQGDTTGAGNLAFYDGWAKIIDAGSPINGNAGGVTAGTGVSQANIIAILQGMFTSQVKEMRNKSDLSIFLPREFYDMYVMALVNANLFHYAGADAETQKLFGTNVDVRPTDGLNGTDRMFLTYNSNLVIGMDGDSDEDNMAIKLDPISGKNIFYDIEFKRGTQVYYTELVVQFTLVP